jgi:hypothetical protein
MARAREGQLDGFVWPAPAFRHAADPQAASAARLEALHLRGTPLSGRGEWGRASGEGPVGRPGRAHEAGVGGGDGCVGWVDGWVWGWGVWLGGERGGLLRLTSEKRSEL